MKEAVAKPFRFGAGELALRHKSLVQASRFWAMRLTTSQLELMEKDSEGNLPIPVSFP
jgi:hypothetical protein